MTHSSNSNDIINEAKKTDQPTYTIRQISNLYKLLRRFVTTKILVF